MNVTVQSEGWAKIVEFAGFIPGGYEIVLPRKISSLCMASSAPYRRWLLFTSLSPLRPWKRDLKYLVVQLVRIFWYRSSNFLFNFSLYGNYNFKLISILFISYTVVVTLFVEKLQWLKKQELMIFWLTMWRKINLEFEI